MIDSESSEVVANGCQDAEVANLNVEVLLMKGDSK
jgi:hypothetical protein